MYLVIESHLSKNRVPNVAEFFSLIKFAKVVLATKMSRTPIETITSGKHFKQNAIYSFRSRLANIEISFGQ